jgi:hypothetical protein
LSHNIADGTNSTGAQYVNKDGKESTDVTTTVHTGKREGGDARVKVKRKDYDLNVGADGSQTVADGTTTTTAGGDASYTHRPPGEDGKPAQPGDIVNVNVRARVTNTEKENGDGNTNVSVGGGVKAGSATADASYSNDRGTAGGQGYRVDDIRASIGNGWSLSDGAFDKMSLKLGGHLRLSDKAGESDIYTGDLSGVFSRGKKDSRREFSFRLHGGQEKFSTIQTLGHGHKDMLNNPDSGYGHFGHMKLGYGHGKDQYTLDGTYGATENTSLLGGHLGWARGKEHSVDLYAAMARQDDQVGTLFRATSKFALSEKLTLKSGGSLLYKTTDEGYDRLWSIYSGLGINLRKGMDLTLKMGVAGDGQSMYYVPEAMYEWKDKFSVSAMANISSSGDVGVGGKLAIPKADLTIFGGYGDPAMMMNPYRGNSGMSMPSMEGDKYLGTGNPHSGYIGLSWDAMPTLRKIFGN